MRKYCIDCGKDLSRLRIFGINIINSVLYRDGDVCPDCSKNQRPLRNLKND
jgi:hypothetical protein